ncbi:MAG: hypothetical protein FGM57_00095 [Candidatus Taylorbacteria bacterium]|nr:hypothetical protein [Candidatus Taylorbacteria bacterium]
MNLYKSLLVLALVLTGGTLASISIRHLNSGTGQANVFGIFSSIFSSESGCLTQKDIDKMVDSKKDIETEIVKLNESINQTYQDIETRTKNIDEANTKISQLQTKLISETEIQAKEADIAALQTQIDTLKSIEDTRNQISSLTSNLSEQNKTLKQLESGNIKKVSTELAAFDKFLSSTAFTNYSTAISNLNKEKINRDEYAAAYRDRKQIEDQTMRLEGLRVNLTNLIRRNRGVTTAAAKIRQDQASNEIANVNAALTSLRANFVSRYSSLISVVDNNGMGALSKWKSATDNATRAYNVANARYTQALSALPKNYRNKSVEEINSMRSDLQAQYTSLLDEVNTLKAQITQTDIDLRNTREMEKTSVSNFLSQYTYSKLPSIESVQAKFDKQTSELEDLRKNNKDIQLEIEGLELNIKTSRDEITSLNTNIDNIRSSIDEKKSQVSTLSGSIEEKKSNMCPSSETECDNGVDDDKNGSIDCKDSACSNVASCTSTDDQTTEPENCVDNVDNDKNGKVDCDDIACSSHGSCSVTAEICGNGIDDDANGGIDCSDVACSMSETCTVCQVFDEADQVVGVCSEFSDADGNPDEELLGNKLLGADKKQKLITNPSECPEGTKAKLVAKFGNKKYYICVDKANESGSQNDKCADVCLSVSVNGGQCPDDDFDYSYNPPAGVQKIKCGPCICDLNTQETGGKRTDDFWFFKKTFTW